ncbi:hypothetical protein C0J52_28293 [Blattella germanica]|nr:hypothetical protein C0J52_28293 [Blattella germanica]
MKCGSMENTVSSLHRKVLKSQTRAVIANVLDFMEREAVEEKFVIDCKNVQERVAVAVGVSESTVQRIKTEKRLNQASLWVVCLKLQTKKEFTQRR